MPSLPRIETKASDILSPVTVVAMSLFGVVLFLPVLASMMIVSVVQFGMVTFLLPLAVIAAVTFFLPLGFGNPYVVRLVRSLRPTRETPGSGYIVQLTRIPRQRSGLWAVLEDADDIGWLELTEPALVFTGDSVHLTVPYACIRDLKQQNAGWRSLFAYGAQTAFSIAGMPEAGTFLFAERSSYLLPNSRKLSREIYHRLSEKTRMPAGQDVPGPA